FQLFEPVLETYVQNIFQSEILGLMVVRIRRQNNRHQAGVGLVRMGMTEFEQPPFRVVRNFVPTAFRLQGLVHGIQRHGFVFLDKGLVALFQNNKDHWSKREGFFENYGFPAVLALPLLNKDVLVGSAGRRPHVDALITAENGMRALERAHGDQVDFDSLAIRGLCKLSNGPFHPTPFFRAVGDTNFDRRAAAQERCRGIFCRLERLLAYENVVSARDAGHYEEENKYPPQGGKFWAFARTGEV